MKKYFITILFTGFCFFSYAQKVGINTSSPQTDLDVRSLSVDSASNVHVGNLDNSYFLRLFSGRTNAPESRLFWKLASEFQLGMANADGSAYTKFLGFDGKTINVYNTGRSVFIGEGAGLNDNGLTGMNIAIGQGALSNNVSASGIVAIGDSSLSNNAANNIVAVGYRAFYANTSGTGGTAVGSLALTANSTGSDNTAMGLLSLRENTTGNSNTAVGRSTLANNVNGSGNSVLGATAMLLNISGNNNTALGRSSLFANTTGSDNAAVGIFSLDHNTSGNNNVGLGRSTLGKNTTGNNNVALGRDALFNNVSGNSNVAIGIAALLNTGNRSNLVAIGDSALYNNGIGAGNAIDATDNTALGSKSLYANTIGYRNTAQGSLSMNNNTIGFRNLASGSYALYSNTTGSYNAAVGSSALFTNTEGNNNTAVGNAALVFNTTGNSNTALGNAALQNNTNSSSLVAVGDSALFNNTTGSANTAIGSKSLLKNIGGFGNTALGESAGFNNTSGSSNTFLGESAGIGNTIGISNTYVGTGAGNAGIDGRYNTFIGSGAGNLLNNGQSNVIVGESAGIGMLDGNNNVYLGSAAGANISGGTDNSENVAVGYATLFSNPGYKNAALGFKSGFGLNGGINNSFFGWQSAYNIQTGSNNTIMGYRAAENAAADLSNCVIIGSEAGFNLTRSNTFIIENPLSTIPLIYGEFDNNFLKINGNQDIANGRLNILSIGDGNELLRFTTDRPWVFKQSGSGSNARLSLQPTTDGKIFEVISQDASKKIAVFDTWNGASKVLLVPDNGNVGIGTSNPGLANKLHVESADASGAALYGSATGINSKGIRVRTTGTSSSANAILAEYLGGGAGYAGYFSGNVHVAGNLSKSSGSFKIDHPLDPENKYLYHSFVESPEMINIYNGNITTGADGKAVVKLPDYFNSLNTDFRYQLTVMGIFAQAIIGEKISNNTFIILTDKPNVEVSWQVTGVRNDAYARENRIQVEVDKEAENKGKYLNPKAFGLPREKAIGVEDK